MRILASALLAFGTAMLADGPCLGQDRPKPILTLATPAQVLSVACSPDGRTLVSGGFDKAVSLWELASGQLRAKFEGHTDIIRSWPIAQMASPWHREVGTRRLGSGML